MIAERTLETLGDMGRYKGGPLPKTVNHDLLKQILEYHGWTCEIGGKHSTKMVKDGCRPITIPRHKSQDFGPGLRSRILAEANLT